MKEIIKKLIIIILSILIITAFIIGALLIFDKKENIAIDEYNFEQLEKVKNIIEIDKEYNISFLNINEFNSIYKSDIKPISNCYYISKYNGNQKFIFGFKLESIKFKLIYRSKYFAYPKYNLPIHRLPGKVKDLNYNIFVYTISIKEGLVILLSLLIIFNNEKNSNKHIFMSFNSMILYWFIHRNSKYISKCTR